MPEIQVGVLFPVMDAIDSTASNRLVKTPDRTVITLTTAHVSRVGLPAQLVGKSDPRHPVPLDCDDYTPDKLFTTDLVNLEWHRVCPGDALTPCTPSSRGWVNRG